MKRTYQKPIIAIICHEDALLSAASPGSVPTVTPDTSVSLLKAPGPQSDISGAKEYHWEEEEEDTLSSLW
ncbi:MAG: hypothetical protein SO013_08840 [Prevotella sp.]|nr:hypothetical protein [Prevotella sp.]